MFSARTIEWKTKIVVSTHRMFSIVYKWINASTENTMRMCLCMCVYMKNIFWHSISWRKLKFNWLSTLANNFTFQWTTDKRENVIFVHFDIQLCILFCALLIKMCLMLQKIIYFAYFCCCSSFNMISNSLLDAIIRL